MPAARRPGRTALPLLGLTVGVFALVPPYAGPTLSADGRAEVVDHVLPGLVVVLVSVLVLLRARTTAPALGIGLVVLLAGLWMTATHVPLLAQASRAEVSWTPVVWHAAPGLLLLALGTGWIARTWSTAG